MSRFAVIEKNLDSQAVSLLNRPHIFQIQCLNNLNNVITITNLDLKLAYSLSSLFQFFFPCMFFFFPSFEHLHSTFVMNLNHDPIKLIYGSPL